MSCANATPVERTELQSHITDLLSTSPARTVAVYVLDANTSEVLVNLTGEQPVKPASCNKLLTTAAALSLLGPEFTFHTRVLYTGEHWQRGGVLHGDLIIEGGGDPTISGRFAKDKRDVTSIFRNEWESTLGGYFDRIEGNIIADDSFFDDEYFHPAWYPAERAEWYEAEISALAFNDNCVDLSWSSRNKLPGAIADVQLNPKTKYVTLQNNVRVAAKGRRVERYYTRAAERNDITASGTLALDSTKEDSAAIHNGALYFATVLKDTLTSDGFRISGKPLHRRGAASVKGAEELIDHPSPPLAEIIKVVNLNSQNFYAECLCKSLGKLRGSGGSFAAGTDVIEKFARDHRIFHEGHDAVDGSGLSPRNRTTARQLVETLRFMDGTEWRDAWRATLPQGGTRGSLKSRFQGTAASRALAPRIFGKTGLIGGVRSLSGFVKNDDGRELYYSIVLNELSEGRAEEGMAMIDRIALALAEAQ
ncbi:MAG: D-alanyl-D-alanine carboxypeptidase/D-alanyl-D-alanine endopeptidase [Candidatus Sumerlaeaceae bacterium]